MGPRDRWLVEMWPFVRDQLPAQRASVLEIGCGALGGFVPMLTRLGHGAVGVDPEAPAGDRYHQVEFERYESPARVDVVVASTSLHHVADLGEVLDHASKALAADGTMIVLEWASERFDRATAQWCFDRLPSPEPGDEPGWLHHARDHWAASGREWDAYVADWLQTERLHSSAAVLHELDARFVSIICQYGPYFFPDLVGTGRTEEQEAIDAEKIRATGLRYVGTKR